ERFRLGGFTGRIDDPAADSGGPSRAGQAARSRVTAKRRRVVSRPTKQTDGPIARPAPRHGARATRGAARGRRARNRGRRSAHPGRRRFQHSRGRDHHRGRPATSRDRTTDARTAPVQMSSDVIVGLDGKPRCGWAGAGDTALGRYHDKVWGTRTYDQSTMFEALTLGVFEVGLSWSIVFGKREAFRGFDVAKVAAMTERDVDRLVHEASIIRNRGKIQATVDNAHAMMSASP